MTMYPRIKVLQPEPFDNQLSNPNPIFPGRPLQVPMGNQIQLP